jgi:beta-glucanase (GH16 family)
MRANFRAAIAAIGNSALIILTLMALAACGGGGGSTDNGAGTQTSDNTTSNGGSGSNSDPDNSTDTADTTKPTITLFGESSVTHLKGLVYIDAGAKAIDDIDGELTTIQTGSVGGFEGVYTITHTATDNAGNTATVTRTVTVTNNPTSDSAALVLSDGAVGSVWDLAIQAFDEKFNNYESCSQDNGLACPSLAWAVVTDNDRGNVLQVTYAADAGHSGVYFKSSSRQNLDDLASGNIVFDIKVINDGTDDLSGGFRFKMESGDSTVNDISVGAVANSPVLADGQWQTITLPISSFSDANPTKFNLSEVDVAISLYPAYQTGENLIFQLDNVRFEAAPGGSDGTGGADYNDANALDATKWFHQTQLPSGGGWYNQELQHYTNRLENSFTSNGTLKIVAIKEPFEDQGYTKQYTSARLNSKYAFTYGRVEVRAKLPSGPGTWPAIWTLGKNINESGAYWQTQGFGAEDWPACGEIDIMEHWGDDQNMVKSAMHTPSSNGGTVNTAGQYIATASSAFHVYSMDWSPDEIVFAVDGTVHYRYDPAVKDDSTWPFNEPQYLLMNFAIDKDMDPNSFTQAQMEVDYVRVYELNAGPDDQPVWQDEFND